MECYAQSLRRIIIHRLLGMPESVPHLAFFGTLVTGAIALPISSELCELGPIFNTDVLGWKSDFQVENCTYGTVTPSLLMGNRETHPLQLCDKFEISPLWKICLQKAGNYLNEENRLSSLQNQENRDSPNDGRKSLLFSDGRQKAARLALFIPREVELDSFRQALCLAAHQLVEQRREVKLTTDLYIAFISVVYRRNLHFFDGQSQADLQEHIQKFADDYEANLQDALEDRWQIIPPARYNEALLRQLCHPYYSLQATTIGYIKPTKRTETRLKPEISKILANRLINDEELDAIIITWINDLLKDYAFNKDISVSQRKRAANYDRGLWGNAGRFRPSVKKILQEHYQLTEPLIKNLEENLLKALSTSENNLHFLDPNNISLVIDLTRNWYHCHNCAFISPVVIAHCCPQCGKKNVVLLSPEDEYIKCQLSAHIFNLLK